MRKKSDRNGRNCSFLRGTICKSLLRSWSQLGYLHWTSKNLAGSTLASFALSYWSTFWLSLQQQPFYDTSFSYAFPLKERGRWQQKLLTFWIYLQQDHSIQILSLPNAFHNTYLCTDLCSGVYMLDLKICLSAFLDYGQNLYTNEKESVLACFKDIIGEKKIGKHIS